MSSRSLLGPPLPLPNGLETNNPLGGIIEDLRCAFLLQSPGGSLWGFWWVTEGDSDVGFCVTMTWLQLTLSLQGRLEVPSIQGLLVFSVQAFFSHFLFVFTYIIVGCTDGRPLNRCCYHIYSINRPGRILNFWTLRVGAYTRLGTY